MSEYLPELKSLGKVKVELDLSNCATKTDLKNTTGIDTWAFAEKADLASLKSNINKLDTDKLKNFPTNLSTLKSKLDRLDVDKLIVVPVDLSKLSDVKNDVVKKDFYNAKIKNIKDKISGITSLTTKATLNAKINEVKGEIPSITNLATKDAVKASENKVTSVTSLIKKTDYNTKTDEIEKKITDHSHEIYIATPEFNEFTAESFDLRLKQANLINKRNFANKLSSFNKRINWNKTKHVLVKHELKKLKTFDSGIFIVQSYFNNDEAQLYLIFQPIYRTTTTFSGIQNIISGWKSKGLSNKKFRPLYTSNKILSAKLVWINNPSIRLRFEWSCLKQEDTTPFTPTSVVNVFIVYINILMRFMAIRYKNWFYFSWFYFSCLDLLS